MWQSTDTITQTICQAALQIAFSNLHPESSMDSLQREAAASYIHCQQNASWGAVSTMTWCSNSLVGLQELLEFKVEELHISFPSHLELVLQCIGGTGTALRIQNKEAVPCTFSCAHCWCSTEIITSRYYRSLFCFYALWENTYQLVALCHTLTFSAALFKLVNVLKGVRGISVYITF